MLPLLTRRDSATLVAMLRPWSVVLVANVLGAAIIGWVIATTVFAPEARIAFAAVAVLTMKGAWAMVMMRGIFAGWIIATMVLYDAFVGHLTANDSHLYDLPGTLGEFPHVVVSSVEGFFRWRVECFCGAVSFLRCCRQS